MNLHRKSDVLQRDLHLIVARLALAAVTGGNLNSETGSSRYSVSVKLSGRIRLLNQYRKSVRGTQMSLRASLIMSSFGGAVQAA
jgi:hypothetical protein